MLRLHKFVALGALLGCLIAGSAAAADNPAPPDAATKEALAQDAKCTTCHDKSWPQPVLSIYQTPHGNRADPRAPTCQSCHGESTGHQADPAGVHPDVDFGSKEHGDKDVSSVDLRTSTCLTCHQTGLRMHWSGSVHQTEDVTCTNCHSVHTPHDPVLAKVTQPDVCFACHKTQRAQIHRISTHPILAGEMTCSDCHNPHGSTGPKLLIKNSVNETCYTCHADKRGPFLWEHSPVVDDCTNCHTPHGSNSSPLLKARVPWLCQECHSGDHAAGINSGANLPGGNATTINGMLPFGSQNPKTQLNARACLNCHVMVHGSNDPAGAKFQR